MINPPNSPAATELSLSIDDQVRQHGFEYAEGQELRWQENDPSHPRHWPLCTKVFNTAVIISLDFFTTAVSTSGSGATNQGSIQYGVSQIYAIFCFTSIYVFGQALGGIIFPAISEYFGRRNLYVTSMFLFSACCVIIGTVNDISAVLVGRLFSALLSAIPTIVVAGSVEDMYDSEKRVWMIFAWGVAANIGLVFGPIYSAFITAALGWQWVFRISAIVTFGQAILTLFLKESRPSQILKGRLARLNKVTTSKQPFTIYNPDENNSYRDFVTVSLTRPTRVFFTEPIVFLVAIMSSVAFGQIYLLTEALPAIYTQAPLNFTTEHASLSFISIGIGMSLNILPRFYDHFLLKRIKAQSKMIETEHKIRAFAVAAPILAIGLWCFAWTIPPAVPAPWPVSFLPLILVGFATNDFDCTLSGYLTDSYTSFSASAISSMAFLRAVLSGALPLFTRQIYEALGANKATTILAAVATAFCVTPFLFLKYGEKLRERSAFARYSREAEKKISVLLGDGDVEAPAEQLAGRSKEDADFAGKY
ncbi:related to multidrug resistant protein [Rhynchosporium secalis]|uniref:Related to multidrug resistant protein n=1 Tax=Rhynchosporium secalis TaxID=38038 RepID=A0A1E1M783_RHYSE|nr:related to multidrug resistant protein [Rhynchosporium secalis]